MPKKSSKAGVHKKYLVIVLIVLAIGVLGGFLTSNILTKNDKFELIGEKIVYVKLGEEYVDAGAEAVIFNKKQKVKIDNPVDTLKEGTYYVKYTLDHSFYRDVARYRIVIVRAEEDEGE